MSNWIMCNCCPSSWDCVAAKQCWNQRVTSADIHRDLAKYDEMKAAAVAAREPKPFIWAPTVTVKKAVDVKPFCPHTERSTIGICAACGDWKM